MFKTSLFAAAIATLGLTSASHSETVKIDCAYGAMTISRIAAGECSERIPLPTQRPESALAKEVVPAAPKQAFVEPEYIEFTTDSGETKIIRLVGPRFLAEDELDLRSHSSANPLDSAFSSALAYFGFGATESSEVAKDIEQARPEEEARPQLVAANLAN